MGTGFLQNDAAWRQLPRLPSGDSRSPFYFRLSVEDRPGALARVAEELAEREISIARLVQHANGSGAALHVVTHEARAGRTERRAGRAGRAPRGARPVAAAARRLRARRHGARMGVNASVSSISLGEGSTPLVSATRLSEALGLDLHLKCEGLNPTGSFKDRGMVVAVERARQAGARAVVCASTGNTAASAAAYAARAGLEAVVLTPAGGDRDGEARAGERRRRTVLEIQGSFDDALRLAFELCERDGFVLVNSASPDRNRLDGQKTVAPRSSSSSAPRPTCRVAVRWRRQRVRRRARAGGSRRVLPRS